MSSFLSPQDSKRLHDYIAHVDAGIGHMIGYPMAIDFDYSETYPLFAHELNNIGDPYIDPTHIAHSKEMEREVVEFYADLFRAPKNDRWGYVTGGGTEGNLYALYTAREALPDAITVYSAAAHYSVEKAIHMLRMPSIKIDTQPSGEIDYQKLEHALGNYPNRAVIMVANIGTTMTEAKDNVQTIRNILAAQKVLHHYIHSDAAFAGIYTSLIRPRHPFDFADGADSVSISGHKFIGSPIPCGVIVTRKSHHDSLNRTIEYTGSPDATISGSRDGHTAVMMWYAIKRWGVEGFRKRAQESIALADYTQERLMDIGYSVLRNPNTLTISFETPPETIRKKWQLATEHGWSHIICSPGMTRQQIDDLVRDLTAPV
ncbi:MAG TPA: histidine decarboxylase [Candidatus Saccharimonadales bacterium]|nr:histidine decarboxylase [Candidatus Saccharimonadales bacterium]